MAPERLLLDQIAAGELDPYLTAIADAIYARQELLETVSSAKALAMLNVGDRVRFNHRTSWPSGGRLFSGREDVPGFDLEPVPAAGGAVGSERAGDRIADRGIAGGLLGERSQPGGAAGAQRGIEVGVLVRLLDNSVLNGRDAGAS